MRTSLLYILLPLLIASCQMETERLTNYAVHGLDVSHYQSTINWDTVAARAIDFTFVKASEGEELKDSLFSSNWENLKRVGIKRGAYHFFRPTLSAVQQARNFIEAVQLEPGDLPPVLDIEVTNNASAAVVRTRARTWLEIIEYHYHIRPIIYTNVKFYNQYLANGFNDYPIWIARYNYAPPDLADQQQWHFWQYGNRGRIDGVEGDVDFNVFKGSKAELAAMCLPAHVDLSNLVQTSMDEKPHY